MQDPSLVRGGRTAGVVRSWVSGLVGGARVPARGCASHLWLMGHFSGWLAAGKLDGSAVTPAVADDFLARRRRAGNVELRSRRGLGDYRSAESAGASTQF